MKLKDAIDVGSFLAIRSIRRSNKYVTGLIIFILTLIFLNLVAIGGLLLGLIRGAEIGYIATYGGSVIIEPLEDEKYIKHPDDILDFTETLPGYIAYGPRHDMSVKLEAGYKEKKVGSEVSNVSGLLTGVDPELEAQTTNFPGMVSEGRFLESGDRDSIVLGSIVAGRGDTIGFGEALENVYVGDKIRASYGNGSQREYTIVGFLETKEPEINLKAYVTNEEIQDVFGFSDPKYTDIHIKIADPFAVRDFTAFYEEAGYDKDYTIERWDQAIGTAVDDVNDTMRALGDIIGGIGLMVGAVTIFILIFVNAVSKRRFIGIMKANGISSFAIVMSYVLQGVFYSVIAVTIGMVTLFGFLIPYVDRNPIDFPFADGVLYVPLDYAIVRLIVLLVVTFFSGLIPAYLIARENTLNAILGR